MRLFLILSLALSIAYAKDAAEFNKALLQEVQKDVRNDNDFNFKKDKRPIRGPASVSSEIEMEQPKSKVQTKDRQIGGDKW
jgi:hypothetical protein